MFSNGMAQTFVPASRSVSGFRADRNALLPGRIYHYPVRLTWEFRTENPIRSSFPLWPVYGLPMLLLRWLWIGQGNDGEIPPIAVFWTLRVLMFILSFVLVDWAIQELVQSPRQKCVAMLLVASSYVTWTYQMHTFSNAIETAIVAWSLVLIERIVGAPNRSSLLSSGILGGVVVFGVFNRITFPAFVLIPGLRMLPFLRRHPLSLIAIAVTGFFTTCLAVILDTAFYSPDPLSWAALFRHPVITPLNNVRYNSQISNLQKHGLHPPYQHLLVNLPLLIGPAIPLLFVRPLVTLRLVSALAGILAISAFPHQEPRFLLPAVPLILSSVRLPRRRAYFRAWAAAWVVFNLALGILMGLYHQGGVVPAQVFMSKQADATEALWWKTYIPPVWLLDGKNEVLRTQDLSGISGDAMLQKLGPLATCHQPADDDDDDEHTSTTGHSGKTNGTYLIAPLSATWLDPYVRDEKEGLDGFRFREVWRHRTHFGFDDVDFAHDGFWNTLARLVGRRGLAIWRVTRTCSGETMR